MEFRSSTKRFAGVCCRAHTEPGVPGADEQQAHKAAGAAVAQSGHTLSAITHASRTATLRGPLEQILITVAWSNGAIKEGNQPDSLYFNRVVFPLEFAGPGPAVDAAALDARQPAGLPGHQAARLQVRRLGSRSQICAVGRPAAGWLAGHCQAATKWPSSVPRLMYGTCAFWWQARELRTAEIYKVIPRVGV